jgi:hypothetical protein
MDKGNNGLGLFLSNIATLQLCNSVGCDFGRQSYFGAIRIAPSILITSPFSISFSMMC